MRSTVRDAATRAFLAVTRGTITKADDNHLMQTVDLELHNAEKWVGAERFQPYGLTSVPLPEDKDRIKSAEAVINFVNGNRAHPVVIAVDDRRYRLKPLKDGEVALYDDQKQKVHITRDGIVVDAGPKKLPITFIVGDSSIKIEKDKITIKATKIITDGTTYVGGEDGAKKIVRDQDPEENLSTATKAYAR